MIKIQFEESIQQFSFLLNAANYKDVINSLINWDYTNYYLLGHRLQFWFQEIVDVWVSDKNTISFF